MGHSNDSPMNMSEREAGQYGRSDQDSGRSDLRSGHAGNVSAGAMAFASIPESFFEQAPDYCAYLSADLRILRNNRAWRELGWLDHDLTGLRLQELVHPNDRLYITEAWRKAKGGSPSEATFRILAAPGIWRRSTCRFVLAAPDGFLFFARDLSVVETLRTELSFELEQRARVESVARVGYWSYDIKERTTTWSNELFRIMGEEPQAFTPSQSIAFSYVHPEDKSRVDRLVLQTTETGAPFDTQFRIVQRSGETRWVRYCGAATREPGRAWRFSGIVIDVTEAHQQNFERQTIQTRLNSALLALDAGVSEFDFVKRQCCFSPRAEELTGLRPMSWDQIFAHLMNHVPEEDRVWVRSCWVAALKDEMRFDIEHPFFRPDGERIWLHNTVFFTRDDQGRVTNCVSVVRDITARKDAELAVARAQEQAQEADRGRLQFLANMSHEIRTPLNGLLGLIRLASHASSVDDARRLLAQATNSGEQLSSLLDDLLDTARIEAGQIAPDFAEIVVTREVEKAIAIFRETAASQNLSIVLDTPDGDWIARTDAKRLRQILFNLISTLVKSRAKSRPIGEIRVNIARNKPGKKLAVSNAQSLCIEISDVDSARDNRDGQVHTVAEPLRPQSPDLRVRLQSGPMANSRFGHSVAASLVDLLGGTYGFAANAGEGSRAWFTLPNAVQISSADDRMVPQLAGGARWAQSPLAGRRILVVEDHQNNQLLIAKLLESFGAVHFLVPDGKAGVEAAQHGNFDAILMDIQMPRMDGITATRLIREQTGPCRNTPVIALTGSVMEHQIASYEAAGMNGVVAKPIRNEELLRAIEEAIAFAA